MSGQVPASTIVMELPELSFTPLLWHTFVERSKALPRTLEEYEAQARPTDETKEWFRTLFATHGHHIRHLSFRWHVVLEATSLAKDCRHLLSLDGGNMVTLPSKQTAEQFWALVRQNPRLVRLVFPRLASWTRKDDMEFVYTTLSAMQNLKDLEPRTVAVNISTLLRRVPQLERLYVEYPDSLYRLDADYGGLRSLTVQAAIMIGNLFNALDRLPGLEELKFRCLVLEHYRKMSASMEARAAALAQSGQSRRALPLKSFEVDDCMERQDKHMALVFGQLPQLVRLRIPAIYNKTRTALWDHCYYLDDIRGVEESVDAWRQRRAQDNNSSQT
ncbi:hypothetical protein BGX23_010744 [Mortierella sp. AD031]|nr:hypothetical protein BGX23_010744 [Mortierella sp. AD031]